VRGLLFLLTESRYKTELAPLTMMIIHGQKLEVCVPRLSLQH